MGKVGDHKPPYDWRHGWIPLTPAAVASKRKESVAGPPDAHVGALSDLTRGELLALTFYGQGGHTDLHQVLGGKRAPDHAHEVITRTLDGLFKRPEAKVRRSTTTVRGVSQAQRIFGSKIGSRVGKSFVEPRYVSTSGSLADADRYRSQGKHSARVYYDLAPGDPAIALDRTVRNHRATAQEVSKLSDFMFRQMYEHPEFSQEVLLPRGLRYQIVSDRLGADGVREVRVRIISDPVDLAISPGGRPADASPVGTPGGRQNWVDKAGGLPRYVRMVAHALMRQGKSESQAIQMAIGVLKNWASGRGNVSPKVRAAAAAAIAQWEAMKAGSRARSGNVSLSGGTITGVTRYVVGPLGGHAAPATVDLAGHWKHGYIPLDIAAALSKAKGDRAAAARYLSGRSTATPRVAGRSKSGRASRTGSARGPNTLHSFLQENPGSPVHTSKSGKYKAVAHGDGTYSIFSDRGSLITDSGTLKNLPKADWASLHAERAQLRGGNVDRRSPGQLQAAAFVHSQLAARMRAQGNESSARVHEAAAAARRDAADLRDRHLRGRTGMVVSNTGSSRAPTHIERPSTTELRQYTGQNATLRLTNGETVTGQIDNIVALPNGKSQLEITPPGQGRPRRVLVASIASSHAGSPTAPAAHSLLHGRDLGNGYKLHESEPGKYGVVELRGPDGKVINSWRKDKMPAEETQRRANAARLSHAVRDAAPAQLARMSTKALRAILDSNSDDPALRSRIAAILLKRRARGETG